MYKKLNVITQDYNPNSGEVMTGSLPELANQPVHLATEAGLWLPRACTQMCMSIATHVCSHTQLNLHSHVHRSCMEISVTIWEKQTLKAGLECEFVLSEAADGYVVRGLRSLDTGVRDQGFV